jgi:hypothetical protein
MRSVYSLGITPDLAGSDHVLDAAATKAWVLGVAAHIGAVVPATHTFRISARRHRYLETR